MKHRGPIESLAAKKSLKPILLLEWTIVVTNPEIGTIIQYDTELSTQVPLVSLLLSFEV
jgi:hypothetical protein